MGRKVSECRDQNNEIYGYMFYCPGCKHYHVYYTKEMQPGGPVWKFNGDLENPTFTPSLLNTMPGTDYRCHIFVTDGVIDFLGDCTHYLHGQIVKMDDET